MGTPTPDGKHNQTPQAPRGLRSDTAAALAVADRYAILKSDDGVTVGLHLPCGCYAEGRSPDGDLEAAVGQAFRLALAEAAKAGRLHLITGGTAPPNEKGDRK